MNELALFAGAGGGILGGKLLGWRTVCAVEIEPYCRRILCDRQDDGTFDPFPIWDDIKTFDGRPWRGIVDVVSGVFPCQDISAAGKGRGIKGSRSGLWTEMARVIWECQPEFVFIENSPLLRSRGLNVVLQDLMEMGYDAKWGVLGAHHVGAPHKRDRIWIVANSQGERCGEAGENRSGEPEKRSSRYGSEISDASLPRRKIDGAERTTQKQPLPSSDNTKLGWWDVEPELGRVADGVANRSHRLKAIGNGQVPAVAAAAWRILTQKLDLKQV